MKKTVGKPKSETNPPLWWISGGLVAVTLYFQMRVIDPFNSPKFWILLLTASSLVGYVFNFRKLILEFPSLKLFFYLILIFVSVLLVSALVSDNRYTAFFGETQRRNGALSYLALATVMLSSALFIRFFNIYKLLFAVYFVAATTIVYALIQTTGNDFIAWNNQYNPIITTLGNPNFAAAVMAIIGVIIFSTIFISSFKVQYRIGGMVVCLMLLILIERSDAKQGLLAYAIGAGIFLIIYIWIRNKWIGMAALLAGLIIFIGGILGMLQIGPLEKFLYKNSVSLRGYYWRAGIEMFQNNPIFGVGIDRYGAYFKQYRELKFPLNHGFEITSNNAHNTFIQLFATGGMFLGLMYLILNFFILRRAVLAIKFQHGEKRLLTAGITCAWIAFHAQSLVSIDNLGVSIWGWVLGGSIVGLSTSSSEHVSVSKQKDLTNKTNIHGARILVSGVTNVLAVILIALLYTGEANAYKAMGTYDLGNPEAKEIYRDINLNVLESVLTDPAYKLISANNLIQVGFTKDGLTAIESILRNDPRNLDALHSLSNLSAQLEDPTSAIKYRKIIAELDPWNAKNYLVLGQLYKVQDDSINCKLMLDKILSFAPNLPIAEQAKIELAF